MAKAKPTTAKKVAAKEALSDSAKLVSVVAQFHTNGKSKDDDTEVYVTLTNGDGTVLATNFPHPPYAPITGEFKEGTDSPNFAIPLLVDVYKKDIQDAYATVLINPNGHNTWSFDFRLTLTFSDFSTNFHNWTNNTLDQDARQQSFPLGKLPARGKAAQ